MARFYAKNRRDGSRQLSSALVIASIAAFNISHPIGRAVCLIAGALSLYWWSCYRRLDH
ncbi:hypothetical protein [Cyanobium sp. Morenito 9A2]|uniref:hypothetical protein n=1 Tax=Cyanobium sp. Morenito 9A2 TaxID=2823718 RepID=UPI0020CE7CB6|nr:hypothetical protein [Cyanobium sp. Morenito 9A2]MCP9849880.1 hypothetical protein [Cyanobium sp. Morenito 9A2]